MKYIDWIFFDLGSTLIDERLAYEHRFRDAVLNSDVSFEKVYAKAVEYYKQGKKGDLEALNYYKLPKTEWHSEDEVLYPDTITVLEKLSPNYNLGIIANQNFGTEKRLKSFNIIKYFDIVISSAEERVAKPDPKIFNLAVSRAKTTPGSCVMIGDRLDNDIIPAKMLGFKTIMVRQGFARFVPIKLCNNCADIVVDKIGEISGLFS